MSEKHTFDKTCPNGGAFCDCNQPGAVETPEGGIVFTKKTPKPLAEANMVKDPSELSEEEQEARQTGRSVSEIKKEKAKEMIKTKKDKPKPAKKAAKKAPTAKKANSPKKKVYVKKGEKDGKPSKRGPKGNKNPVRNAPDEGVYGRKIARARKEKGWSQATLAEKSQMTQPAICNIEKGTAGVSYENGKKIAKILGIEPPKEPKEKKE